jgi:dipeptidyl aminopeptidase/acylaminoacyl peptidase
MIDSIGATAPPNDREIRVRNGVACLLVSCLSLAALVVLPIYPSAAAGPAADSVPLDVYGRLPSLEDVIISPDGKRVAYVKTKGDERDLAVVGLDPAALLGGVKIGASKLREAKWIDNDRILIRLSVTVMSNFTSDRASELHHLLIYNLKDHSLREPIFSGQGGGADSVVAGGSMVRNVGGESVLFVTGWTLSDHRLVPALYSFTGDHRATLVDESRFSSSWLVDENGQVAAHSVYDDQRKKWEIRVRSGDKMKVAASGTAEIEVPQLEGFSTSGDAIIISMLEDGDPVWRPLNLNDNTLGPALDRGVSLDRVIGDRTTGRIVGGIPTVDDAKYVFFDNEVQAHWNAVLRAFPGEQVLLASHSDDFSKMIVRVFGPKSGNAYFLYDWYSHQATLLGQVYVGLGTPAEVRVISYAAADGLTIPGFLTLPHGKSEKALPLVVLPHGGPAAADGYTFDWWAQALAAVGYAVLQPNYRGSALDWKFQSAGFGEYGRKMQTDLSDGVRYLATQGIIDPRRVCIVGASYGGYAALAGVTLDAGVYRCAVSVSGISDLKRFRRGTFTGSSNNLQRYLDRYMGASYQSDPALVEISPIEHISRVTVPILLIHGRGDGVVPYEQSEVMASALKRAGKPVQFITLGDEDHWLSRSETRLQMLNACVDFLRTNNPPN